MAKTGSINCRFVRRYTTPACDRDEQGKQIPIEEVVYMHGIIQGSRGRWWRGALVR